MCIDSAILVNQTSSVAAASDIDFRATDRPADRVTAPPVSPTDLRLAKERKASVREPVTRSSPTADRKCPLGPPTRQSGPAVTDGEDAINSTPYRQIIAGDCEAALGVLGRLIVQWRDMGWRSVS